MTELICPICGAPLVLCDRALRCESGHSYDIAASGYCNLLRPGKLRNRTSGDDRGMVLSRGRFLSAGYYSPILDYAAEAINAIMPEGGLLIDAGCGEGYYTNGIARRTPGIRVLGVDASKHACEAAAKGASRAGVADRVKYITASSAALPLRGDSAAAVLSIFSPCDYGEFARVTSPEGWLLVGSAGRDHLFELKEILYGRDNVRENVPIEHAVLAAPFGYCEVSRRRVTFSAEIVGGEHIMALYSMTPYRWRTPREGEAALSTLPKLTVTVDFDFTLLELKNKA